MLQLATLHRGAKPAFTIFYRAGAKELENTIYSPQVFLLRKKDVERASMTGESSRKNLNILGLEIIGFYTSHTTLGLRPRVV